jgi:hypothetical protein
MTDKVENARGVGNGFRIARWSLIALLLVAPLIAMRFTDEVKWTASDFAFAGVLLGGAGLVFEAATLKVRGRVQRTLLGVGVIGVVLVVWVEAAVGIFH